MMLIIYRTNDFHAFVSTTLKEITHLQTILLDTISCISIPIFPTTIDITIYYLETNNYTNS